MVFQYLLGTLDPDDQIGLQFNHEALTRPLTLAFTQNGTLTADILMNAIMKVLNSHQEVNLFDVSISIFFKL